MAASTSCPHRHDALAEELCRLASDPGTAPDIAEEAIPTIVGLLKASTKPSAEAAKALNELAKHQPAIGRPSHADLIREAGGIPALVALIPSADGDEELLRTRAATEAAGALWSLLHDNEENRKALREANGIPALVKMLMHGGPVATRYASGAGHAAVGNALNRIAIREQGIPPLVSSQACRSTVSHPRPSDGQIHRIEHVARAILNLAYDGRIGPVRDADGTSSCHSSELEWLNSPLCGVGAHGTELRQFEE